MRGTDAPARGVGMRPSAISGPSMPIVLGPPRMPALAGTGMSRGSARAAAQNGWGPGFGLAGFGRNRGGGGTTTSFAPRPADSPAPPPSAIAPSHITWRRATPGAEPTALPQKGWGARARSAWSVEAHEGARAGSSRGCREAWQRDGLQYAQANRAAARANAGGSRFDGEGRAADRSRKLMEGLQGVERPGLVPRPQPPRFARSGGPKQALLRLHPCAVPPRLRGRTRKACAWPRLSQQPCAARRRSRRP
jgi:hypothetical protein